MTIHNILHLLRGLPTAFFLYLLLFAMTECKFKKVGRNIFFGIVVLITVGVKEYFYVRDDLPSVSNVLAIIYFLEFFLLKPFFKDNLLQWIFSYFATISLMCCAITLSVVLAYLGPMPRVTVIFYRLFLMSSCLYMSYKYLRRGIRELRNYWGGFAFASMAIALNYMYYFGSTDAIRRDIQHDTPILAMLCFMTIAVYHAMFYLMQMINKNYLLQEENKEARRSAQTFELQLSAYDHFIEVSKQNRHDMKHHNAIVLQYLKDKDYEAAKSYLMSYDKELDQGRLKTYCTNKAANAVLFLYDNYFTKLGIKYSVQAEAITEDIPITSVEIGTLLGNILENALESCERSKGSDLAVSFSASVLDRKLCMELTNTSIVATTFEEEMPLSLKERGGLGTRSIKRIILDYHGSVRFMQKGDLFYTQLIIPL